ncbi:MAG: phosphoenolpyruvate mutase [Gammaproteobacteria bacterium]|nr:phosphoenolpyruvate mutase [Gammaproteobacteria bacterium]MBT8057718.1 phosphoenolpyruvate mutase [Gammaproteobacteria bacterium]NNJ78129.1 phosphoenolpyruvate mutase [Xanthomonadales bacterium]
MKKTRQFRDLLSSSQTEFIMEAHNGLAARIVEEAGFKGIWGSGLALSAQHAVRDNNELSWTQVVDTLEFMSDATSIPILLDGDTGYGDFNNMRRLVHKLEQRDIAGVCIEDKLFPKTNSFIQGEKQELEDVATFCGKIQAGKDAQSDDDFSIVARVEALIAGWGLEEALRRAEAYRVAGADAILIHSKKSSADEVLAFAREWDDRCPLVIVPTKYYATPTEVFRRHRISLVIWANHLVRSSIRAMQATARAIHDTESLLEVEGRVATVSEIFRLQGADELIEAEKRYARPAGRETSAVVLAASRGRDLDELTTDRPKAMIPVAGTSVLRRMVDRFKRVGINEITVVGGYRADAIDVAGLDVVVNEGWEASDELASLDRALDRIGGDTLIVYGDLLFRGYILDILLEREGDLVAVVDSSEGVASDNATDLAWCSAPDNRSVYRQEVVLQQLGGHGIDGRPPDGCWVGMMRVRGEGRAQLRDAMERLRERPDFDRLGIPDLINHLIEHGHAPEVQYISGHWMDINDVRDLSRAGDFAHHEMAP